MADNKYIISDTVILELEDELSPIVETVMIKTPVIRNKPYLTANKGYYVVDNDAIEMLTALGVSTGAKLVYMCLVRQAHNNDKCYISIERLAAITGISERSVNTHIKSLKAKKLIEIDFKGGIYNGKRMTNEYKVRYVYAKKETKILKSE